MSKKMFLILDVETTNCLENPLVYDVGFIVCDKKGKVYLQKSFTITDIFCLENNLMQSAYYNNKIPLYIEDLKTGDTKLIDFINLMYYIRKIIKDYKITSVCAYNAYFDTNALNNTLRYLTKSKMRWFFPYGIQIDCIWHMACQVLYTQKAFLNFAVENGFVSASHNIFTSAEVGYKYLTQDINFEEIHRGLQDVQIEKEIMLKCYQQKKPMKKNINRLCWNIPTKYYKECYGSKP